MSTPVLTLGEKMFEEACTAVGICCRRIPVASVPGHRRPDYKVHTPHCGAIVEVKEVAANQEDRRQAAEIAAGQPVAWTSTPGARLRLLIKNASDQLRRASLRGIPTAVAIFDTTRSISYTDAYNVKVAMFGLDAVVLALPNDPAIGPYSLGMKSAGKAVLTEQHNTSVSAVIIVRAVPPDEGPAPLLLVYHNHFARIPFDPEHLRGYVAWQYRLARDDNGATGWVKI